jgi:hypothetical protein
VQKWNSQVIQTYVEEKNPPGNQSLVVVDLAQCYCYKRQFAEEELGWRPPFNFAMIVNQFCIFFSHALQLNVFGAWWGLLLVPKLALVPLHNFSGGCHSSLELAEMFRLLAWLRFAGLSGKRVTNGNFFS